MTNNERDEELIGFMKTLEKDDVMSYLEKMQKVINWKMAHRDLKGLRISLSPSANDISNEEIAKELFMIELNGAEGNIKEVDVEVL